jgi:hypothetical protein
VQSYNESTAQKCEGRSREKYTANDEISHMIQFNKYDEAAQKEPQQIIPDSKSISSIFRHHHYKLHKDVRNKKGQN